MVCSYCHTNGVPNIPSVGDCVVCQHSACTHPSGRHDNKFHGYFCECQCNQFVCHVHYSSHSRGHPGGGPSTCFPAPTVAASGTTLAVIERDLGLPFDVPSPIGELDRISEFILGIASTPQETRHKIAIRERVSPSSIPDDQLPRRVQARFLNRRSLPMVAVVALHMLTDAWKNLPHLALLPDEYARLEAGVVAMHETFDRDHTPPDPLSDEALAAYYRLSPRIAMALGELRRLQRPAGLRSRSGLWAFLSASALEAADRGFSDSVRSESPVLTDLLPDETRQFQYL